MNSSWEDEMLIGIELIDDQHKELFSRLDILTLALYEGGSSKSLGDTISFLKDYVRIHFTDEVALMQEVNYPDIELQKEEHQRFTENLRSVEQEFLKYGASLTMASRFEHELVEWFKHHVLRLDKELARYVKKQKK